MRRYIVGRLVQFLGVVIGASLIVFIAAQVLSDPVEKMFPVGTDQEVLDGVRAELGFDDPLLNQYARFVSGAVTGDFNNSIWLDQPALGAVLERLPATVALVVPAMLIGLVTGAIAGMLAGMRPGSFIDSVVNVISHAMQSVAEFWFALMLILIFAVTLKWLPTGGYGLNFRSLALPVAVLSIRPFAHTAQMMRSSVIHEGTQQYVMTARSKGLSETSVARRHVLRNAAIPVLTLAIYDLSQMLVGVVAVEVVFGWPGMGRLAYGGLIRGDVFLLEAVVVVAAVLVASLNLVGDVLNFSLDPRTRATVRSLR